MSRGSCKQVHAKCPFFRLFQPERKRIVCEGILENESTVSLSYQKTQDWEIQADTFCCDKFQCCEVYQMLMGIKYPEGEEEKWPS